MTIFVDLNGTVISTLMAIHRDTQNLDEDVIREAVLNRLREFVKQFKHSYGKDVVIACDSKKYWRRDIFPYYKATRKRERLETVDWALIFDTIAKLEDELARYFPYHVINIMGAEADDVIAVLVQQVASKQTKCLIVSSDRDFLQLQKYSCVDQYSPYHKNFMKIADPDSYIREKIICGDRTDGIPNFLSPDDVFVVDELRQKRIMKTKLAEWIKHEDPTEYCDEMMLRGYKRNERLVDFDFIPASLRGDILEAYNSVDPKKSRGGLIDYCIKYHLRELTEYIDEF